MNGYVVLQRQRKANPLVDDEAQETPTPFQGGGDDEMLEDIIDEEEAKPKTWTVKDEIGETHTVSIKETKGKWIYMSTGARIKAEEGKSAEEVVQACINAGDESDLVA